MLSYTVDLIQIATFTHLQVIAPDPITPFVMIGD